MRYPSNYELRGDKVFPSDSAGQFDAYKGMDGARFLSEVRDAVGRPATEVE